MKKFNDKPVRSDGDDGDDGSDGGDRADEARGRGGRRISVFGVCPSSLVRRRTMPYFNSPAPSAYDKDDAAAPAPGPSHASGAAGPSTSSSEPIFMIEHLATFTVAKEAGIMYPADGMRRLCQLEKSNGIWSQKMQLRLERNWVLIMDTETGIVMERFPAALIQEPTAFITRDPMEMYNNILVFIVADESGAGQQGEMHIFQCQSVSAQDLVRDLQRLQLGELIPAQPSRGPRGQIPPPPTLPPPEPPLNSVNVREQVSAFNAATNDGPSDISREENNDEVSSTSSEKYERDVTILNHCFDDIEKFIARLQHAAAASRELERRRRNSKSKKRNLGDGMLTMRAKPPPESEFVDIFQKFKLSFNLLAKLKAHIHDPNAPELVHFLFTPLALIVDASHDTNYDSNLPSKVVSPLLTREAVNLLIHCVTSKETELWHSLGDTWLVPRDQWKNHVPAYHPIFMDGWSPECPIPEDHRDHDHLASLLNADKQKRDEIPEQQNDPYYSHREVEESHYSSDYLEYEPREERTNEYFERNYGPGSELYAREERDRVDQTRAHSDISVDSIERGPRGAPGIDRAQESWLDDLLTRHAKIVQVTYPRTANNDKELTVVRGEYLEILDDSRKWWKARNSRGQVAHVPHTIVTPHNPAHTGDSDVFNNPVYASRYQRQGHGYNYEDSEIEGTSTSPGPDTTHRPHAIPPPAPADWVRKERLGKKGSSVSSALEREVSLKWQIRKTLTKIQKPAEKASSSLSSKVDDQDLADIETEIAELSVSSVPMPPPFPKGLFTRSKRFDISFANSGRSRKSSAGSSKSRKSSAGSSKSREGSAGSSKSREGSAGSSKSKKGSAGSSKSKDGSADSSKPKEGSAGSSKPKEGSAGSSKSKEGSAGSSKTKEGSAGCSNSKEGSAGSSKSKEGSAGSSKSKEGSAGSSKSKEGCAGSSKSEEASGSSSTFGTINSKKSNTAIQQDKMQEELKSVMMLYRGKKRNADDFKSHLVYVTERSTPREVQKWLKSKAFSDILCKKFRGMTGAELFTLTKSQLERQCGISEGRRLDGQLVLSRNASGYYATRTGELKKVLEEARQKVENVTIKEPPKKE